MRTVPVLRAPAGRRRRLPLALLAPLLAAGLLAACQSAASSSPSPAALFRQGLAAQGAGHLATARADYAKVIALDPTNHYKNNKYVYYDMGVLDQEAGNSAAAAADYRKALLVDPNYQSALYNLAIVETPGSPQSAILLYQQILAINPKDANTLYNLGLLLYDTGQISQGQADLRQAIVLAPSLRAKLPASVSL